MLYDKHRLAAKWLSRLGVHLAKNYHNLYALQAVIMARRWKATLMYSIYILHSHQENRRILLMPSVCCKANSFFFKAS